MIKTYLTTLLIVLMTLTVAVGVIKPKLSKPVQFSVKEMQVVTSKVAQNTTSTNLPQNSLKIENENVSNTKTVEKVVDVKPNATKQETKIVETKTNVVNKTIQVEQKKKNSKTSTKVVDTKSQTLTQKTVSEQVPSQKVENKDINVKLPTSVKEIVKEVQPLVQADKEIVLDTQNKEKTKVEEKVVVLPKVESKSVEEMTPEEIIKQAEKEDRMLNEREEIVVWNVWRSNLQNQIMMDTQVSAPLGTVFKFSFTVDKKGRISNLRTWAQPSMYNSVAINYLKPLIQSYQGKSILNFPSRTKRVITNVTGGFTISTEDKFSTPNDFSDIERIRTTR